MWYYYQNEAKNINFFVFLLKSAPGNSAGGFLFVQDKPESLSRTVKLYSMGQAKIVEPVASQSPLLKQKGLKFSPVQDNKPPARYRYRKLQALCLIIVLAFYLGFGLIYCIVVKKYPNIID